MLKKCEKGYLKRESREGTQEIFTDKLLSLTVLCKNYINVNAKNILHLF